MPATTATATRPASRSASAACWLARPPPCRSKRSSAASSSRRCSATDRSRSRTETLRMAKEDSGRLLSKVAKFVRNPLKDWSELDADESSTLENGYSREMLKEMIERRQRNDFVRRREFDMLRKLRQREAAGERDPAATPSSFNVSSTSGKTEGRALTLKKIDEIEEQMSQQWWKGRSPRGAPDSEGAAADGEPMAEQHARAYADTVPGVPQGGRSEERRVGK